MAKNKKNNQTLTNQNKADDLLSRRIEHYRTSEHGWNDFASDILGVSLDGKQQEIIDAIQHNSRVVVKSGHARGKDYLAAVSALCFLFLNYPSKVLNTAPTDRQVNFIMMSEIRRIYNNAKINLGGELLGTLIRMPDPDWFLLGFKPTDSDTEKWTGYHSQNLYLIMSEASGMCEAIYNAVEGILTGNSKLLLVGNPNNTAGGFFNAFKSDLFKKFTLNCHDAPNVVERKVVYPGQVDYKWVDDHVNMQGWTTKIREQEANIDDGDFCWNGEWYRPSDLYRVKILGLFPKESPDVLIPYSWIEQAIERWKERYPYGVNTYAPAEGNLSIGVDIAGLGTDKTVIAYRTDNALIGFDAYAGQEHMQTAGIVKKISERHSRASLMLDTIGEGAGVYSRLKEQNVKAISVKFSESAEGLTDKSGQLQFTNLRSYCYWMIRDLLNPQWKSDFALPDNQYLIEELNATRIVFKSNGKIQMEEKEKVKEKIGRSPDYADAFALSLYPINRNKQIFIDTGISVRR